MEKNFLPQKKFLLTSLNFVIKAPKIEEKEELKAIPNISLPIQKFRYSTLENKIKMNKEKIFIRNMKSFVAPISKSSIEKNKINLKKIHLKTLEFPLKEMSFV